MRSWLPTSTPNEITLVIAEALRDVGEHEIPAGSNRGAFVDAVNTASGSPLGSSWCANAAAKWWRVAGWKVPPVPGACDQWRLWAQLAGRLSTTARLAAVVLYGTPAIGTTPAHADHCGLVVCVDHLILSVEGNTTLDGYSRNGEIVTLKDVHAPDRIARVLGYVLPPGSAV